MNDWQALAEEFKALASDATLRFTQSGDEPPHWQLRCDWATCTSRWFAVASRAGILLGDQDNPRERWWQHLAEEYGDLVEGRESLFPCYYDDRKDEPFAMVSWQLPQLRGRSERACLLLARSQTQKSPVPAETTKPATRKGRPRKSESDSESIILAALAEHHKYECGGGLDHVSIGNYEPAGVRELANREGMPSTKTITKFFEKHWQGHRKYAADCRQRTIGVRLAVLLREPISRMAKLRHADEE